MAGPLAKPCDDAIFTGLDRAFSQGIQLPWIKSIDNKTTPSTGARVVSLVHEGMSIRFPAPRGSNCKFELYH